MKKYFVLFAFLAFTVSTFAQLSSPPVVASAADYYESYEKTPPRVTVDWSNIILAHGSGTVLTTGLDLNPIQPGIQNSRTVTDGYWIVGPGAFELTFVYTGSGSAPLTPTTICSIWAKQSDGSFIESEDICLLRIYTASK